jgi:FlgD Ig-like domain
MAWTARAFGCANVLLLCVLALAPGPAEAAGAANFVSVDAAVPGHVTGVVHSDEPYVALALVRNGDVVEAFDPMPVANGTGKADFDLAIWGLSSGSITAAPCTSPTECDAPTAQESFTQPGVEPTVSWPTSTTVGPGDFKIDVTDPDGGGFLFAKIQPQGAGAAYQAVSRSGSTTLDFVAEGPTAISILRCRDASVTWCQATDASRQVVVNRVLEVATVGITPAVATPGPTGDVTVTAKFSVNEPGDTVTFSWELFDRAGLSTGLNGETSIAIGDDQKAAFTVVAPGLSDGTYELRGTASLRDLSAAYSGMTFTVDGTPPGGATLTRSPSVFYPYPDDVRPFKDRATLKVFLNPDTGDSLVRLEIVNSTGSVVRTVENQTATGLTYVWTGRDDADALVPAGSYTLRVTLEDPNGNRNALPTQTIRVRDEQLTLKTLRRSLSAVESASSNWKARCSAIRRPASRGWAGSLQLISNAKCRARTWLGSGVATVNAARLPAALEPGRLRVSAIGGAARGSATSVAVLEYWNNNTKKWVNGTRLSSAVGSHSGPERLVTPMLYDGRRVAWRVATGFGMRYDVRAFEVTYTYLVLE